MNAREFFEAMGEIDNKYVDEAICYKNEKKRQPWIKWGAMAACICIIAISILTIPNLLSRNNGTYDNSEDVMAYGFTLEGSDSVYFPISFDQRKFYGLVDDAADGLTDENTYEITSDDLGGVMGKVANSENKSVIGTDVYYFADFPNDSSICIVEVDGTYEFYVKSAQRWKRNN